MSYCAECEQNIADEEYRMRINVDPEFIGAYAYHECRKRGIDKCSTHGKISRAAMEEQAKILGNHLKEIYKQIQAIVPPEEDPKDTEIKLLRAAIASIRTECWRRASKYGMDKSPIENAYEDLTGWIDLFIRLNDLKERECDT